MKDTLIVPIGVYGYIKIGDKVYKIDISLNESKPDPYSIFGPPINISNGTLPIRLLGNTSTIYYDSTVVPSKKQKVTRTK